MKLLLTSEGGFPNPDLVAATCDLVGKPAEEISFAVINEAYPAQGGDKRWVVMQLNALSTKFGGDLEFLNLRALSFAQVEERLAGCDAVYCVGGHTDFLMRTVVDSGFDKIIQRVLETKVWVGSSAGSMIIGHRAPILDLSRPLSDGETYGVESYLELVDLAISPHIGRDGYPSNLAELTETHGEGLSVPIFGLRDDAAVMINGDQVSVIGSEPLVIP